MGVFLWILQIFKERLFYRTSPVFAYACSTKTVFNKNRWSSQEGYSSNCSSVAVKIVYFCIIKAVARKCSVKKVFLKNSQRLQQNTCARSSLLAYWYITARVIYAFISLVLYFKDFWFILEIPMPSASFLEETSDKEHTPLWIRLNIQVCMFVVFCWNMFFLSKELLTSTIN